MIKNWKGTVLLVWIVISVGGCSLGSGNQPKVTVETPQVASTFAPRADVTVEARQDRPNILLILVDDLDAKLGTLDAMPNLQNLVAAQGLTMEDFFINTPVCCPSRSSILRGQYTHNHQVYTNAMPLGGFEKFYSLQNETSTLATWLQAAGYRTALFGKYFNGYPFKTDRTYIPPGWADWYSPARGTPYKEFNYYLNENGILKGYGLGEQDYMTDVLSQKVDEYLRRPVADTAPFFIYLAPYAPHEPAVPAPRHADLFPDLKIPRTAGFNEVDVADKPSWLSVNPLLTDAEINKMDELYRQRVRSMQAVDEMIARIVSTLKETGQLDNTYIIFTSDNGYHLGQHRLLAGKGKPYDEDIVVPFIIRGPGILPGENLKGYLTGNVDIAPTIAELAGIIPPAYVDGRSLVPLWSASRPSEKDWRQGYLIEYYGSEAESVSNTQSNIQLAGLNTVDQLLEPADPDALRQSAPPADFFAIRTTQYLYVEYQGGERELYDMVRDPLQLDNLVSTADPGLLNQLSSWLKTLASCSAESCRNVERAGIH
jgi:N-acetylglucosamine-6-sulfatase